MAGWIKIHRTMIDHWINTDKRKYSRFEAWMDILLSVNYADAKVTIKNTVYEVKRGQSIYSLDTWSKRWGWNKSATRRFFVLLEKDGMIELKTDTQTTQLTVCNYARYQDERNANETQVKRKRNTDETQTTLREERKKNKEEKEDEVSVEKHALIKWIEKECPQVAKMKYPLTNQEAERIMAEYEKDDVKSLFNKMDNWAKLSNNTSANKTFYTWAIKDIQKKSDKPKLLKSQVEGIPYPINI